VDLGIAVRKAVIDQCLKLSGKDWTVPIPGPGGQAGVLRTRSRRCASWAWSPADPGAAQAPPGERVAVHSCVTSCQIFA
jgi:hypothetical protein